MPRTKYIATTLLSALLSLSINAATVSVVNQTSDGPSNNSPTMTQGSGGQSGQSGQKAPTGPVTGKLTSKKGGVRQPRKPKLEQELPPMHPEQPTYTYPGLLAKIGKRWVGNDYLYNMHRNIGVKVEVVRKEGKDISIDEEGLAYIVADIFQRGEIIPESLASEELPPLPFFHILIFAFPSENSNIAFVSGRLFEDALFARYGLDPIGTWQAISWEKQDLVITSPLQFDEQLKKSVANIAATFIDRVEMYAKIKAESESNAKLYYPSVIPAPAKPDRQAAKPPAGSSDEKSYRAREMQE